jgi:D-beta-D-heptose 7-phosphate kinase/D-beta-D-heptose 1-phosphate adenosyltransferase
LIAIPPGRAEALLERMRDREVLVIGDVILDRFIWGSVDRISPEAPVPVVRIVRQSAHLGGAANVAANLASLGTKPVLLGIVGDDAEAEILREAAKASGVLAVYTGDPGRPTTVKTRVIARSQHVVRVDREPEAMPSADALARLGRAMADRVERCDALVVSDYAKGAVDEAILRPVLVRARLRGIPVVADPKPPRLAPYQPITVLTPNQAEASRLADLEIGSDADCVAAADSILARIDAAAVLVTRGDLGMMLRPKDGPAVFLPAVARQVFDVTGAGDTVAAVTAAALAGGGTLAEAAFLANHAGGVAVGKVGTASVRPEEILAHLSESPEPRT